YTPTTLNAATAHSAASRPSAECHQPDGRVHLAHRPQVLDERGAARTAQDGDDVDAYLRRPHRVLGQPACGQAAQPGELGGVHRLGGVAEPGAAAGLDLDEGDRVGPRVAGDDV